MDELAELLQVARETKTHAKINFAHMDDRVRIEVHHAEEGFVIELDIRFTRSRGDMATIFDRVRALLQCIPASEGVAMG